MSEAKSSYADGEERKGNKHVSDAQWWKLAVEEAKVRGDNSETEIKSETSISAELEAPKHLGDGTAAKTSTPDPEPNRRSGGSSSGQ